MLKTKFNKKMYSLYKKQFAGVSDILDFECITV